jgi:glycosyltransferase involved in cell wall biosynthesis
VREPSLSVVIPVLNEELALPEIVATARARLEERDADWEIVIVDNASTDGTVAAAAALADGERVRLLRNDADRGKGYSIRRGMLEARGDLRLMCDADCAPSLASLPAMLEAAEAADVVAGSRATRDAQVARHQPLRRRAVGLGFLTLCRLTMGEPARDIFCGFKLWRAEAAEAVFSRTSLDGWSFDVEALALARGLGFTVREQGIAWVNRPSSRLRISRSLVPVLRELLRARRHVRAETRRAVAVRERVAAERAA